jgi:ubiquitin carboxyl-terminal hydrolase 5/13
MRRSRAATAAAAAAVEVPIDEESLGQLVSMGFSIDHATRALRETSGNVERAMEWIFSHPEDEFAAAGAAASGAPVAAAALAADDGAFGPDGPAKYRVRAFVSHMGTSVHSGHYVCHANREEPKWAIYNDRVVAECSPVPIGMAYIYLLERINN